MSRGAVPRKRSSTRETGLSDDEANRRRPCYQLMDNERHRKLVSMNDLRRTQLGILQEILFNQRNAQKSVPKAQAVRTTKSFKMRPTSAGEGVERARVSRSPKRDHHQAYRMSRSVTNVAFMSDRPNLNSSPDQFRKLLVHLSSELNNLESITGFKSNRNDLSAYSSSTALATALIGLVGHVKQCGFNAREITNLKDQLSIVIRNQLDFQEKIDQQITSLQTMMQTVCQLVNNEAISNRKGHRDQTNSNLPGSHQNWLNNAQRPYLIEKDTTNAMDELLMFTRRMNNGSPAHSNQHSAYIETIEASKRLTRPTSGASTIGNDLSKSTAPRSSMISPLDMPLLELPLPRSNLPASPSETILEKILQERLRLVQQMSDLNKQHEMTQEELAHLEGKSTQT